MSPKAQQLEQQLTQLSSFINITSEVKQYPPNCFAPWVADCVALFSSLGVEKGIIDGFMTTFAPGHLRYEEGGAFYRMSGNPNYTFRTAFIDRLYYYTLAFQIARNKVRLMDEANRLVEKWIPELLRAKGSSECTVLAALLENIEQKYQNRDGNGLATDVIAFMDNLLDLEPSLAGLPNVSLKLKKLYSPGNTLLCEKFGIPKQIKEIAMVLDTSRVVRNVVVAHPQRIVVPTVNWVSTVATTALAVQFLQQVLATGALIR